MSERKFTVIKGGISTTADNSIRTFLSAYITDTRLMGVVGLYIHWELSDADAVSDFHQFFYFDAEEYGFESYKSLLGSDPEAIHLAEQALIGGLGGSKVVINQREAEYMIQKYTAMNTALSLPIPEGKNEYEFLLQEPVILTKEESANLIDKLCTPIVSDYQLINYFLMRLYARDFEGAEYLLFSKIPLEEYADQESATLCKNSIEEFFDEYGCTYLCESLLELDSKYKLVISEITIREVRIESIKIRSSFYVTAAEAAMMLNHPEFVTVYEVLTEPEEFLRYFSDYTAQSMQAMHDNGRLYLEFKKNNDHVNRKVFRLNEDVRGLYYITDFGQFIIAAYSLQEIHEIEKNLGKSEIHTLMIPTAKYEFKEPILYEFIQSDFDDFSEFIDFLNS